MGSSIYEQLDEIYCIYPAATSKRYIILKLLPCAEQAQSSIRSVPLLHVSSLKLPRAQPAYLSFFITPLFHLIPPCSNMIDTAKQKTQISFDYLPLSDLTSLKIISLRSFPPIYKR